VNNYIMIAAMNGIFTMLCYIAAKIFVVWAAIRAWKVLAPEHRWTLFAFVATLIAIALSELSVSVFGPALVLNGVLLGATVSIAGWARVAPAPTRVTHSGRRPVLNGATLRRDAAGRGVIDAEGAA